MTQSTKTDAPSDLMQRIVFRRQFLLGPVEFVPTPYWRSINCGSGLILSAHQDLDGVTHSTETGRLIMLGYILNPLDPARSSSDIVKSLLDQSTSFEDILKHSIPLTGRWILLFINHEGARLFTDPCGLRQVYYYRNRQGTWCGSQPEIIKAATGLDLLYDAGMCEFIMDPRFARTESNWIGDKTRYRDCYHLLPNHYLDLSKFASVRFSLHHPEAKSQDEIVECVAALLKGGIEAMTRRSRVIMAVTGGRDSRTLLAASRPFKDNIEYYVDRMGVLPEYHPDIRIPTQLTKKLGLGFVVKNSRQDTPGWFVQTLANNVTGARFLPKTRTMYSKLVDGESGVNINGNASGICKDVYRTTDNGASSKLNARDLAALMGYAGLAYVEKEMEAWQADLDRADTEDFPVLDLLYWEQRMGNWGAQYPAEQDIAIEEFMPFNCRWLMYLMHMTPEKLRSRPDYPIYSDLIRRMWPEALALPINPRQGPTTQRIIIALKNRVRRRD